MSVNTVLNPATEETIAELPAATAEDADRAVATAKAAFPAWRAVPPAERARLLRGVAMLVERNAEELALLETRNVGKPIADSRAEAAMIADVFHFYAGAVEKHHGETIPVARGVDMTFREPLGVVGLITPWNFPMNIASWKLGPALACGNTVVLKPACTLVEASNDDRVAREEVFGPVAAVIPFEDEEDAVRIANHTPYGLSGSIWTENGARALRVARALESGVLSINSNTSVRVQTPFGGFKQWGFGRELGLHALEGYFELKNVYYATDA